MLSPQALDDALAALLDQPLDLRLFTGGGVPAQYEGYAPQPVSFGPPASGDDGYRYRTSDIEVRFPPVPADHELRIMGWQLRSGSGVIAIGELVEPLTPRAGEIPFFVAGAIKIGMQSL